MSRALGVRRPLARFVVALGGLTALGAPSVAHAQWGYGWGMFGYQPSPATNFINDKALVNAAAAANARPQALRAPSSGNFRGRDPDFFQRYDISTRRAMEDRVARRPSRPTAPTAVPVQVAAATQPAAPAVAELASFFNRYDDLVWPSEAPVEGELGTKRASSNQASLATLREQKAQGQASIATVTNARNKLLDYGRPALQIVRASTTTAVADSFHAFLLSLYDSLGQALKPPRAG